MDCERTTPTLSISTSMNPSWAHADKSRRLHVLYSTTARERASPHQLPKRKRPGGRMNRKSSKRERATDRKQKRGTASPSSFLRMLQLYICIYNCFYVIFLRSPHFYDATLVGWAFVISGLAPRLHALTVSTTTRNYSGDNTRRLSSPFISWTLSTTRILRSFSFSKLQFETFTYQYHFFLEKKITFPQVNRSLYLHNRLF